jgi:hypothetical protein
MARLEAQAAPDRELGLLAYREQQLWSARRETTNFGHRRFREQDREIDDAAAWLAAGPTRQLLVQEPMLEPCFHNTQRQGAGVLSRIDWFLVTGNPDPICVGRGDATRAIRYRPPALP